MSQTLVDRLTSTPEGVREFQRERAILEVTELICALMEKRAVNKSELARRLSTSKGYITQLLDGRTNMTLRTVSDVMWALDSSLHVAAADLNVRTVRPTTHDVIAAPSWTWPTIDTDIPDSNGGRPYGHRSVTLTASESELLKSWLNFSPSIRRATLGMQPQSITFEHPKGRAIRVHQGMVA